jgi:broad specificity phosphatase PhoE
MKTMLFLIRHGATASNLARPPRLQGRYQDPPLAPLGIRQAELTQTLLAVQRVDACYCSPLQRAYQTAELLCAPHGLLPVPLEDLTECDVGHWEGLSWEEIAQRFPAEFSQFMANPARHGYPGGENFADVHGRASRALEGLLLRHEGEVVVVVAHHIVNRTYLAGLLGLPPEQARQVSLANCSISLVVRDGAQTELRTLNSLFHLQGIAA